jgi:hypothetical protein
MLNKSPCSKEKISLEVRRDSGAGASYQGRSKRESDELYFLSQMCLAEKYYFGAVLLIEYTLMRKLTINQNLTC